jgi:D-inositol-3-phosphate glycosyltransferase
VSSALRPLVIAASWRPATGFTRVVREIARGLAADREVHYLGLGYKGDVRVQDGFVLHPCNLRGGDVFGAEGSGSLIDQLGARVFLAVNDFWILHNYRRIIQPRADRLHAVAYIPIDGTIPNGEELEPLRCFNQLIAYTEFGRNELSRHLGDTPPVRVIPHGMDLSAFKPWKTGRAAARLLALPNTPEWQKAFVVLNANRPVPRKRIDLTIEAFARFARNKPDARLVLHFAIAMPEELPEIAMLLDRSGVRDRTWLSLNRELDDTGLNALYNACDVGINTAAGEGWGLVSFEHAAAGAAQIVPDNSACTELWQGAAELVACGNDVRPPYAMLGMREPNVAGVANALERLYHDANHRRAVAEACYSRATDPKLQWRAIDEQWRNVIANNPSIEERQWQTMSRC